MPARFELEHAAGEALARRPRRSSGRRAADLPGRASTPWRFSISRSASSMRVSVVSPRKSILSSASFSRPPMSYWVTISSRLVLYSGTSSFSGCGRDHHAGRVHASSCAPGLPAAARPPAPRRRADPSARSSSKPGSCSMASFSLMLSDVRDQLGDALHVGEAAFRARGPRP